MFLNRLLKHCTGPGGAARTRAVTDITGQEALRNGTGGFANGVTFGSVGDVTWSAHAGGVKTGGRGRAGSRA